jgi:DNA polymerase I
LIAVAFDLAAPTFRHKQFEDYKKDRKPMPDDLSVQIPLIYEVISGFNIPIISREEYEADDLIGSLACTARDRGYRVVLATSDKDFYQLVGNGIFLFHTTREVLYGPDEVKEAFGLPPEKVVDVMAIWGDSIDNIPGVPGIGEKGAKSLIGEFGSLDALYENLEQVKKKGQREALEKNREQAFLSRELATIRCDLEVEVDFDALRLKEPDREKLHELFARLEFHSLMQEYLPEAAPVERHYELITTPEALRSELEGVTQVMMFIEPIAPREAGAFAAVSRGRHRAAVVPLDRRFGAGEELRRAFAELLAGGITIITHDAKQLIETLQASGLPLPAKVDDVMLMSYALNPGAYSHELDSLIRERLGADPLGRKELGDVSSLLTLEGQPLEYAAQRADLIGGLHELFWLPLEKNDELRRIYEEVELPLVPVLVRMEARGILIDVDLLRQMSETMGAQVASLEERIYEAAGERFNINSPSQLGFILFERLQYRPTKKTQKTKSYSTGVEVLRELASHGYEIPRLILEHRELHKLKSTYVDALPQLVGRDGRLRTSFNQAVAATGRLSSSDPNLQNIPIRTAQGREIRKAFIAPAGRLLLAADYSQIELRILAHMTQDPDLIDAFQRGADIHRATAARIFNLPEEDVSADQRRASKTINFGVLYGMSSFRLSHELGISVGEAKEFIDAYFARYPRIQGYLDSTLAQARATGEVRTMFGRTRQIPEIHNRSWTVRGNAERMATNAPIQGTAADLLKFAMIALDRVLMERFPDSGMLLTVHDEIVLETPSAGVEEMAVVVRQAMESVATLAVPLAVDLHWGPTWYDTK